MRRRNFIQGIVGSAAAWPLMARAQQPKMPVIGSLYAVSAAEWTNNMAGFRRGLSELSFVEGQNVAIEYRWADGRSDRLPALAADLVARKVAVILAGGSVVSTRAAIAATQTIPIVFTSGSDPIAAGFVASLNRPGGNVTGVTLINNELVPKRLELLHVLLPTATKIAMLVNQNNPVTSQSDVRSAQSAARRLGLEIIALNGGSENEIEMAFTTAAKQRVAAVHVSGDAYFTSRRNQIAALSLRHAIPTISQARESVVAGELMSYGANPADVYRQAGVYAGRILKGEKPANLPVMQPTKFEFVINLKTAKALGVAIPDKMLALADEVIE